MNHTNFGFVKTTNYLDLGMVMIAWYYKHTVLIGKYPSMGKSILIKPQGLFPELEVCIHVFQSTQGGSDASTSTESSFYQRYYKRGKGWET